MLLVEQLPVEEKKQGVEKPEHPVGKYIEIFISSNAGEVALIKSLFDAEGIDYYFQGERFHSVIPLADPVRLMVREDQTEDAKKLLDELEESSAGLGENSC